jgi:hypothetical protein
MTPITINSDDGHIYKTLFVFFKPKGILCASDYSPFRVLATRHFIRKGFFVTMLLSIKPNPPSMNCYFIVDSFIGAIKSLPGFVIFV